MTLDTFLYIAIGLLLLTGMGALMPFKSWKNRTVFVFVALFASILIIIQGFRIQGATKQSLAHNLELENLLKEQKIKEEKLHGKIDALLASNKKLEMMIAPFQSLAMERFPGLPSSEALEKLRNDLSKLQSRTTTLEQETQKTVFHISNQFRNKLPDGTFESKFTLDPIGTNIIPILTIICQTENKAAIVDFRVDGPTLPGMSFDRTAEDKTAWG